MKLQSTGKEFWLVVPKEFIEQHGWTKGDVFFSVPLKSGNGIQYIHAEKRDK